ncbi:hypothetical protein [Lentzea flava]|uniref:hypothetical protein n=1 Tax=Lentzea flava TaxID=103732 RepID=UPI00166FA41D|nr:hypothetical protein [Lentzea flava]
MHPNGPKMVWDFVHVHHFWGLALSWTKQQTVRPLPTSAHTTTPWRSTAREASRSSR